MRSSLTISSSGGSHARFLARRALPVAHLTGRPARSLPLQPPPALRRDPPGPRRSSTACAAGGGKRAKQQNQQKQREEEEEEEEDDDDGVIYLDGEDEREDEEGGWLDDLDGEDGAFGGEDGGWLDDDDDGYLGEGGGAAAEGAAEAAPPAPGSVATGGAPWGADALAAARAALAATPGGAPAADGGEGDLRLYSLRCFPSPARVDVRLDRLSDVYGSPSLEDIETFSRRFAAALEEALGANAAGGIVLEVSSPGAERLLALPEDLPRFASLPLRVEFDPARAVVEEGGGSAGKRKKKGDAAAAAGQQQQGGGEGGGEAAAAAADQQQQQKQKGQQQNAAAAAGVAVLELSAFDEAAGTTEWRLADVRANAPAKGRGLSKRQREQRWLLPLDALQRVRVHVDF